VNDTIITVTGNLVEQPELSVTPNGTTMARIRVASTPRVFDKARGEYRDGDTLFLLCTAWRDLAEHAAELAKGTRVIITGRLTQSTWQTEDGDKRTAFTVQVDDIGASLRFATVTVTRNPRTTKAASAA
jgi:single-strand DNA-binding protein